MTSPRIIVVGATTAITRRTTMRKAFLAPWHPGISQAWLYSLALGQKHTRVAVHHAASVVTHHHITATPEEANLPRFLQIAHHEFSCATNTLLARERYDQPGELFDGRATHLMRLCDDAAQSTHLIYEYLNTAAAGLVARPEHMPGFVFDFDLWLKGHIDVPRPDFYFSDRQPEVLRLHVTPPPLLYLAFGGDVEKLVYAMKRLAEQGIRELRARQSRPPLGARAVTRLHPWSEPRTLRERRGKCVPTYRIGARGITGREAHIEAARETRHYHHNHEAARVARRAGDLDHEFPFGTYKMRVEHGVPVADPDLATAIVTRPGPTLREVQAMLDARRPQDRCSDEQRIDLVERTRDALVEEADAICEHAAEDMDFSAPKRAATVQRNGSDGEAARGEADAGHGGGSARDDAARNADTPTRGAVVRHRFDKPARDGRGNDASRVVTLRDRRRSRRPSVRHGSDPPA